MSTGYLILEDGACFSGKVFGCLERFEAYGEVVFNTAMTGYEEVLTDPSYQGQIVAMTSVHQGNYGITLEDQESNRVHVAGFVVHEACEDPSNWRAKTSLPKYLKDNGILGISHIDTRSLTLRLRLGGAMRGVIVQSKIKAEGSALKLFINEMTKKVKNHPLMEGLALAPEVSVQKQSSWGKEAMVEGIEAVSEGQAPLVAVWDFGVKWSILRYLQAAGFRVCVLPYQTKAEEILYLKPLGVVLSNGPGDPAALSHAVSEIKELVSRKQHPPVLGICLGHQLLGLGCGAKTYKMKFGHHGVNHPVKQIKDAKVWITSHNHGFAVDPDALPRDLEPTWISLNDQTLEGMSSEERNILSVQFHPEAAPGPWEAVGIFRQFKEKVSREHSYVSS